MTSRWTYVVMAAGALAVLGLWETSGPASAAGEAPEHLPSHVEDWNTNWDRSLIDPESLSAGGPHRDGIPSIDQPRFIGVQQASEWLAPSEPVIALEIDGEARAYPLQILVWHEIVNDHVAGVPAVVTYCPLCNAALAFDARVQGRPLSFGTSGLLRNSDLVMYDRTTETLWQQFTGRAIVGDLAGEWLEPIATQLIGFGQYAAEYPHGGVLSRETGYNRKYGRTPYPGYDRPTTSSSPLGVLRDRRLRPMQRVLSFTLVEETEEMIREVSAAIPLQALAAQGALNFTVAGEDLVALHAPGAASALDEREIAEGRDVGGTGLFSARVGDRTLTFVADGPLFRDEETGTRWTISGRAVDGSLAGTELDSVPHYDTFWFVWVAFQPDTMLWGAH